MNCVLPLSHPRTHPRTHNLLLCSREVVEYIVSCTSIRCSKAELLTVVLYLLLLTTYHLLRHRSRTAGISERPLPGSMVGPTFACIIGKQFHNYRHGDRYWYENGGWPSSFTLEQLAEIRKAKLSRIMCDNSDDIETLQVFAMVLPDHEINPRVPCKSSVLPSIDLSKWRDATYFSSPSGF